MAFSAQRQRVTFAARCRLPVARSFFCQRVILLTDGQANHGIIDPAIFVKHAAELTEEGIATTTIGYGEDFNEALVTVLTGFPCRFCIFPAASWQRSLVQADAGGAPGAAQRLRDFLAAPEVAASTDPEIQAARRRIKEKSTICRTRGSIP